MAFRYQYRFSNGLVSVQLLDTLLDVDFLCSETFLKRKHLQKVAVFTTFRKKLLSWKIQGNIRVQKIG